ncbi:MAG TPA: aromatic acid exporter family protein [Symbiobacteriaceae bacterium]|nr:aromatic acid exporter family protein [Symbiobacteriaceae bacterium]
MDLPFRVLKPFTGPRVIKTGLAVFLALLASHAVRSQYGAFAAVAAMLAVQPSVSRARQVFTHQVTSNLIGGLVGAGMGALGLYLGQTAAAMALGVVLVLGICVRLKLNETAALAVTAVIFIMDRPEGDFFRYTAARLGAVMGGMLIGALVNRFIKPPNYLARVREDLSTASARVHTFGEHLIASLASPQHYRKNQIKAEAREITARLESAGYFLELSHEADAANSRLLPMDKARASMYVFKERIMDIHKVVLQAGGLVPGDELAAVAGALSAVLRYKSETVAAALESRLPDPGPAEAFAAAQKSLEQVAERLIDQPEARARGLALHMLLTNIRHMGWRMESLTRLLKDR